MGEDLDSLSLKELQNLEKQLDTAVKHIRSKKVWVNSCPFSNYSPSIRIVSCCFSDESLALAEPTLV